MSWRSDVADVFIVGGGPAGLAAAIRAAEKGFRVLVADRARPPIDKACGEGLMPGAAAELAALGVRPSHSASASFQGIRFVDGETAVSVQARFPAGAGVGVRRTILQEQLVECAAQAGVQFAWGARITGLDSGEPACGGERIRSRWIVGADGPNSELRRRVAPTPPFQRTRFGFRRHFRVVPWTDFVEIYWSRNCQVAITPIGPEEVGVVVVSRHAQFRMQNALDELPSLAQRLPAACASTRERGSPCTLRRLSRVQRERFALVGDASGSVDPITGEGLELAFRQSAALADSLAAGDLDSYQKAHARIDVLPHLFSRFILAMDAHPRLRQRTIRLLAAEPALFSWILQARLRSRPPSYFGLTNTLCIAWRVFSLAWDNSGADV